MAHILLCAREQRNMWVKKGIFGERQKQTGETKLMGQRTIGERCLLFTFIASHYWAFWFGLADMFAAVPIQSRKGERNSGRRYQESRNRTFFPPASSKDTAQSSLSYSLLKAKDKTGLAKAVWAPKLPPDHIETIHPGGGGEVIPNSQHVAHHSSKGRIYIFFF